MGNPFALTLQCNILTNNMPKWLTDILTQKNVCPANVTVADISAIQSRFRMTDNGGSDYCQLLKTVRISRQFPASTLSSRRFTAASIWASRPFITSAGLL